MKSLLSLILLLAAFFYVQKNMSQGQPKIENEKYEDIQYYRSSVHNSDTKEDVCIDQAFISDDQKVENL